MPEARFAPAREQVAAWQHALGRARDEARHIPDVFVQRRFERALHAVAADFRRVEEAPNVDAALLEALEGARQKLGEAHALLDPVRRARGAVERTLKVLATIDKALVEARLPTVDAAVLEPPPAPAPPPPMRASLGLPCCFEIARDVVLLGARSRGEVEPDDVDPAQAWRQFPPVDASVRVGAVLTGPAPEERARLQVVRVLQAAFAELGALGWLRRSRDSDVWYEGTQSFEDRMLAQLDAIVASGRPQSIAVPTPGGWTKRRVAIDLPETLLRWSDDAVPGDTSRAFCRALVLGCLRGADSARAAVAALDAPTGLDSRAAAEALALASSPDVAEALREACSAPRIAVSALDVARRRGSVDVAAATAALASADTKIARAAARALGTAVDRELAVSVLSHALEAGLDPDVECAACESLLRLGESSAFRLVRERARIMPNDRGLTPWLRLLALSPDRGDAQVLQQRAGDDIERLEAWGWAGRLELADALLERIEAQGKGITPRAHLAIFEIITGVAPPEPFEARALREAWPRPADTGTRYLRGRPLSLEVALEEQARFGRVQRERRFRSLDIALASRGAIRIDPDDWVARQRARIHIELSKLRRSTST